MNVRGAINAMNQGAEDCFPGSTGTHGIHDTHNWPSMRPVYFLGWCFFRLVFKLYFRWRVHNPERVPIGGPVILACNHASYIDPPLVGADLHRPINYLAREDLFRFPL